MVSVLSKTVNLVVASFTEVLLFAAETLKIGVLDFTGLAVDWSMMVDTEILIFFI